MHSRRAQTDAWMHRAWHMRTMEYYAALQRKDVLTQAPSSMDAS